MSKKEIIRLFLSIFLVFLLLTVIKLPVNAVDLHQWSIHRALYVNQKAIQYSRIFDSNDLMTHKQAYDRTNWIMKYAMELNYMYPQIHHRRVAKDFFAIVEVETKFINYRSLDNGLSFGVCSMKFDTAEWIAEQLDEPFNRYEIVSDVETQIKYAVWYYYYLLKFYDDRYSAMLGYNVGLGLDKNSEKWRNYFYAVIGRLAYYEYLWNR